VKKGRLVAISRKSQNPEIVGRCSLSTTVFGKTMRYFISSVLGRVVLAQTVSVIIDAAEEAGHYRWSELFVQGLRRGGETADDDGEDDGSFEAGSPGLGPAGSPEITAKCVSEERRAREQLMDLNLEERLTPIAEGSRGRAGEAGSLDGHASGAAAVAAVAPVSSLTYRRPPSPKRQRTSVRAEQDSDPVTVWVDVWAQPLWENWKNLPFRGEAVESSWQDPRREPRVVRGLLRGATVGELRAQLLRDEEARARSVPVHFMETLRIWISALNQRIRGCHRVLSAFVLFSPCFSQESQGEIDVD